MLTLKLISEETERVIKGLEKKHFKGAKDAVEKVLETDKRRREAQQKLDKNKQEANSMSRQIGMLMKDGKTQEAEEVKAKVAVYKENDKQLQAQMDEAEQELTTLLCNIPNIPADEVPEGKDANDNVVVKEGGTKPNLPADAQCHWDLLKKFNLVDFDLGVKITGAAVYGLQRAFLVDWFFVSQSLIADHGYYPVNKVEENDSLVQIVTSNPTSLWPEIEQGYVRVLTSAKHYVYMEEWSQAYPTAKVWATKGLEKIFEDLSIYWNDDLAYSLTYCCKSLSEFTKSKTWRYIPLYHSDMKKEKDTQYKHNLN